MPKRLFILNTVHSIVQFAKKADIEYIDKVFGKTIFSKNEKKSKNKRKKTK